MTEISDIDCDKNITYSSNKKEYENEEYGYILYELEEGTNSIPFMSIDVPNYGDVSALISLYCISKDLLELTKYIYDKKLNFITKKFKEFIKEKEITPNNIDELLNKLNITEFNNLEIKKIRYIVPGFESFLAKCL